jgi:hypothetical protein
MNHLCFVAREPGTGTGRTDPGAGVSCGRRATTGEPTYQEDERRREPASGSDLSKEKATTVERRSKMPLVMAITLGVLSASQGASAKLFLSPAAIAITDAAITSQSDLSSCLPVNREICDGMKVTDVFHDSAPVRCERLRLVRFFYVDFSGQSHDDGEIMVLDAVCENVQAIFEELYKRGFPINKARLLDRYHGNDENSMADNNTSAFNDRPVTGGKNKSLHAYGLAIDVNPVQNPFVAFDHANASFSPPAGADYANRLNARPNKAVRSGLAEEVVDLFAENGFLGWGGYWDSPIDYQHFEVPRTVGQCLAEKSANEAHKVFSSYVERYRQCRAHPGGVSRDFDRATCVASAIRDYICPAQSP